MSLNYVLKLFIWEQNTKYYIAVCTYINQYVSGYTSLIQLFNSSFYLIFTESIITSALQCICSWMLAYLKFVIQDWPEIKDIICQNKEKICTLDKLNIFLKILLYDNFPKLSIIIWHVSTVLRWHSFECRDIVREPHFLMQNKLETTVVPDNKRSGFTMIKPSLSDILQIPLPSNVPRMWTVSPSSMWVSDLNWKW